MVDLIDAQDLPSGFHYPDQFLRLVGLGLIELQPWRIIGGRELRHFVEGLPRRYPDRTVVPFARRIDNDDVAVWDLDRHARVSVLHDWASPGYEQVQEYEDTYSWLRQAVEDFIEFDL